MKGLHLASTRDLLAAPRKCRVLRGFLLAGALLLGADSSKGQSVANDPCPHLQTYTPKDTGDTVEGPVCVGVKFNALRNSGQLGRTVTVTAGPNLSAGLTLQRLQWQLSPRLLWFDRNRRSNPIRLLQSNVNTRAQE